MKIICHGGAGHTPKVQDGVDKAAEEGWKILKETDNPTLAATAATIVMEDDFRFNAGTGSCLRDDGRVQTDAAVATTVVGAHALYLDTFGVNTGGSTTTGRSNTTLNIGATHATNDTWRLVRSAEDPENNDLTAAYCSVVVIQNLNQYIDSSGS